MRNFIAGFATAAVLAVTLGAAHQKDPEITGGSGYLKGVEVVDREGDRLCESPFYGHERKIISCE